MNAAILYFEARRTSLCQELLCHGTGFQFAAVRTAPDDKRLEAALSSLLPENDAVVVLCAARDKQPAATERVCRLLGVPLWEGRPVGVLRLLGGAADGYLIESPEKTVALLPDRPECLAQMLPDLSRRLREKYRLPVLKNQKPMDFEALVGASLTPPEEALS